jgi:hypothetical protein
MFIIKLNECLKDKIQLDIKITFIDLNKISILNIVNN